jgi:endonuclease YncB( thermonuclease family)
VTTQQYVYKIKSIAKVTDGDTYWINIDPGFHATLLVHCRLIGYDTPEKNRGTAYEKAKAIEAQQRAALFLANTVDTLWLRTDPDPDSFGRWLCTIWAETEQGVTHALGPYLEDLGLASRWPTHWRDQYEQP